MKAAAFLLWFIHSFTCLIAEETGRNLITSIVCSKSFAAIDPEVFRELSAALNISALSKLTANEVLNKTSFVERLSPEAVGSCQFGICLSYALPDEFDAIVSIRNDSGLLLLRRGVALDQSLLSKIKLQVTGSADKCIVIAKYMPMKGP